MNTTIELSYNINRFGTKNKQLVTSLANHYDADSCTYLYEFEGKRHIDRSHCIITIVFSDYDENNNKNKNIDKFLKSIAYISNLYVECIFDSDNNIIHSSCYYNKNI